MFKDWINKYKCSKHNCESSFRFKNRRQPDSYYFDIWAADFHLCIIRLLCFIIVLLFTLIDFVISCCKMAQEIIKQGIPANVLTERAAQFKKAKSNEQLRDELPSAITLYHNHSLFDKLKRFGGNKSVDISRLQAGKEIEYRHLDAGFLKASNHNVVDVPLLPSSAVPIATDYNFTMSNGKRATALHVGAIEVVVQAFTSPDSDLMAGMMLVDTMHSRPENAIRSVYIVPLRSGPQMRALCFPNTLVPLNQNVNKRFKVVFSLPNVDFPGGEDIAHVSVNVAGCTTGLQKSYIPSPLLTEEFNRESASVIEYLGTHTYAMQMSNLPTQETVANLEFDFRLGGKLELGHTSSNSAAFRRTRSLRYTIGGKAPAEKEDSIAKPKVRHPAVDPKDDLVFANPQEDIDLFKLSLDDTSSVKGSLLDTRFAQTRIVIPKAMAGGNELLSSNLYDILVLDNNFRAAAALAHTHIVEGQIKCVCTINLPENTGCCLALCVNSSNRGKFSTDIYTIGSQDRMLWNPACSKNSTFIFNPNPCGTGWSLEFLRRTKYHISVVCVSGWSAQPQTDLIMTVDFFVANIPCAPRIYNLGSPGQTLWLNRWMGKLTFGQGVSNDIKSMPLAIGGGAGAKNSILMNMTNAYLSLWRYFHGDLVFEINKMSSPYIKSTITFFIGFGGISFQPELEDFPNKLVQFSEVQEKIELKFTRAEFLTAWSTQVDPAAQIANDGCPYLYALVHDSTASTILGDFNLGVTLTRIENFSGIGCNPGIQGARLLGSAIATPQNAVVRSSPGIYSNCFSLRSPIKPDGPKSFTCDLMGGGVVTDGDPGWSVTVRNTPVSNLLRTAAWKRGTVHVQVVLAGATIKRSDWDSTVQIFLRQSMATSSYDAKIWDICQPGAAMLEFSFDVVGPNNGFEMWDSNWASQTSWFLEFLIANPAQNTLFDINLRLDENFSVAGTTLMPPFVLDRVSTARPLLGKQTSTVTKSRRVVRETGEASESP